MSTQIPPDVLTGEFPPPRQTPAREEIAQAFVAVAAEKKLPTQEELEERAKQEESFMLQAEQAKSLAGHDDECALRKGKECGCRANLVELGAERLTAFERKPMRWVEDGLTKDCVLVRVDDGRAVQKVIPDPLSQTAKPITITVHEPPRWICTACASSMRGTDLDHHCDPAVLRKARSPMVLAKTLPPEVKFGGAYRLTLWRDRAGEYWLGEEVVVGGKVIEERTIAGPESYNVIEGAILDAADSRLTP